MKIYIKKDGKWVEVGRVILLDYFPEFASVIPKTRYKPPKPVPSVSFSFEYVVEQFEKLAKELAKEKRERRALEPKNTHLPGIRNKWKPDRVTFSSRKGPARKFRRIKKPHSKR